MTYSSPCGCGGGRRPAQTSEVSTARLRRTGSLHRPGGNPTSASPQPAPTPAPVPVPAPAPAPA